MHDRPTAVELIAAARQYLETDLIPNLTDSRQRFQTLVAANVLSIVERELQSEETHLTDEWNRLAKFVGLSGQPPERLSELRQRVYEANADLCERIRRGEFDGRERFRELSAILTRLVQRKLEVANPKYLANFYGAGDRNS